MIPSEVLNCFLLFADYDNETDVVKPSCSGQYKRPFVDVSLPETPLIFDDNARIEFVTNPADYPADGNVSNENYLSIDVIIFFTNG